ncbi:hypothetical protein [Mesoflavibacter zeaxanthinifaciens]|uniref:hypothetical protein n=1 Tax=Mesoflavibacter zeaxanthinifaciens TaxID=393060 RepID=UPI003A8D365C
MKRFLLHIAVFVLLFLIIDQIFYVFIAHAPKKEDDQRLQYVLDGQMNKDVIVLGSSRGANNIIAKQLENSTGLATYNLSYRGSNIEFQEFLLKTLLKYNQPPKYLCLVIDNSLEFKTVATLNFRYDRLFPLKNYAYINDYLVSHRKQNVLSKYLNLARVKRKDFIWSPKPVLPINVLTSHGAKINILDADSTLVYKRDIKTYDTAEEEQVKLNAFKSIQQICETKDIHLIYVFPPNFVVFNTSFYKRFKALDVDVNNVMIYNQKEMKYQDYKYFRDESHLNKFGAEVFTKELSDFIKSYK